MLELTIPGFAELKLAHVIFDYNGTLALDGRLIDGVVPALNELAKYLQVHIVTGDTLGTAKQALIDVNCTLSIMTASAQGLGKLDYLQQLGVDSVVAVGNGRNDKQILAEAKLGIIVLGQEGAALESLVAADVIVPDILSAIALLTTPRRITSTLRA